MRIFSAKPQDVAARWKEQYYSLGHGAIRKGWSQPDRETVYCRILKAKGASEIDEIIGNRSWTSFTCDNCETDNQTRGVIFPTGDPFESSTVCKTCVLQAYKELFEA